MKNITLFLFLCSLTIIGCKKEGNDKKKDDNLIIPQSEVTNLVAIAGDSEVLLRWSDPVSEDFDLVEITFTPTSSELNQPVQVSAGSLSKAILGLANGMRYTFTVKTLNKKGDKSVGVDINATPVETIVEEPTVMIDQRDGRQYKIVRIGEQVWMAENLAYIPEGKTFSAISEGVSTLNDFSKHFYVYGFDEGGDMNALNANSVAKQNFVTYGVLYNWYAAIDVPANVGDLTQLADYAAADNVIAGIAPEGWHIPSDEDWKVLERYLGMSQADADKKDYRGTKQEGNKLKSQSGWETNDGTDNVGFGLVPNGRWKAGKFELGNQYSYLWSSTFSRINNNENVRSWLRYAKYNDPRFGRQDYETFAGYAIRCIKDSE